MDTLGLPELSVRVIDSYMNSQLSNEHVFSVIATDSFAIQSIQTEFSISMSVYVLHITASIYNWFWYSNRSNSSYSIPRICQSAVQWAPKKPITLDGYFEIGTKCLCWNYKEFSVK